MDLIGGPFSVIESDPADKKKGVFTSLTRRLGVKNLSVVEVIDIEPWATDHLQPHGLVFCFHWRKDVHTTAEFENPEQVWFANQVSDDACATHAILNVLLNCPTVNLGPNLQQFRDETKEMSPIMKGLAVTNSTYIRNAHNYLARQTDLRGSLNVIATATLDAQKAKVKEQQNVKKKQLPSLNKSHTPTKTKSKNKPVPVESADSTEEEEEAYHFIGYVPAFGKVWELDGLKPGPLEVGELPSSDNTSEWMDVVRPAIRMKMAKYGGGADAGNIRFSLLAFVDGSYEKANDEWEYWRRERRSIERRLDEIDADWKTKASDMVVVNQELLKASEHAFTLPDAPGHMILRAGSQRLLRDIEILSSSPDTLLKPWEHAVRQAVHMKNSVQDEIQKAADDWTDHIKRTHDYEPFCVEYIRCLHRDGFLEALLDISKHSTRPQTVVKTKKPKMTFTYEVDQEGLNDLDDDDDDSDDDNDKEWKPPSRRFV
ncbi:ubiquitin C-terminal hydrolase [Lentinula aciculospora]|uniref:ubiquitinyl hydrolase 1 n=1 Tax=Lentinula aciculospora TaxID=153920 RepID=A0A9W9DEH5_9AGAR|nr:ubiquitin C-terminal hydrolase [Lentinula aciculospora]